MIVILQLSLHSRIIGKPSQAEIAGEALRNVLSTLIKHPLIITDPVHVRWFALEALRQPVLDRIETNTHSAIQVQQMPTIRVCSTLHLLHSFFPMCLLYRKIFRVSILY